MREVVDVDSISEVGHRRVDLVGLGPQNVGAARHQRMLVEPDDVRGKLVGNLRTRGWRHQHIPARHLDFVGQHQRDRLPFDGAGQVAALGDDAFHRRRLAGFCDNDFVADRYRARRDRAGEAAEIQIGPVDILHRKAERPA